MRTATVLLTVMVLAFSLVGCGESSTTTTAQPPEITTTTAPSVETTTTQPPTTTEAQTTTSVPPRPSAESVWTQLLANQSYRSWQTALGHETPQPATGPHGEKDQVFVSEIVMRTLGGPSVATWPVDSIIVKDVYDGSGTLIILEYMQRTDEGWYYASFDTNGQVQTEGVEVRGCQNCHGRGSDSVFTFKLP
ncbi:MAG: hypothetical protein ACYC6T_16395 [Thermoleophilia bacterium]